MATYINMQHGRNRETVDEFTTRQEARAMLKEYHICEPYNRYYISTRACANWKG